jgi:uncharacterized protein (TIGR01777 family)
MKIVIPGGSGHIGTVLARAFHARGDEVVVLSRNPIKQPWRTEEWDGEMIGGWALEFEKADAIINLAGQSVQCRYNEANKKILTDSRLNSTRVIGDAIARAARPPGVWLQASTATIYAHRYDAPNDEATGIIGGKEPKAPASWRFSIDLATSWEQTFNASLTPKTRKVLMRSAIMMSPDPDGPFDVLLKLVRFGLGGSAGNGKQYMSWIHDQDFVQAVLWLIEHNDFEGPVNLASPHPLPNSEFMQILRHAWGAPVGLPATELMLEIGAFVLGSETELILKSRRVVPARLLQSGLNFQFPTWAEAAVDLCWRARQRIESAGSKTHSTTEPLT